MGITRSVAAESSRNEPKQQCDRTESDVVPPTSTALFTEEQERRFRIHFEEGFEYLLVSKCQSSKYIVHCN